MGRGRKRMTRVEREAQRAALSTVGVMGMSVPAPPPAPAKPTVMTPAFEVTKHDTIRETVQINGKRLVEDAFGRASRAHESGIGLDAMVYLTMVQKLTPSIKVMGEEKETPAEAKATVRNLKRMLEEAEDANFNEVPASPAPWGAGEPALQGGSLHEEEGRGVSSEAEQGRKEVLSPFGGEI